MASLCVCNLLRPDLLTVHDAGRQTVRAPAQDQVCVCRLCLREQGVAHTLCLAVKLLLENHTQGESMHTAATLCCCVASTVEVGLGYCAASSVGSKFVRTLEVRLCMLCHRELTRL